MRVESTPRLWEGPGDFFQGGSTWTDVPGAEVENLQIGKRYVVILNARVASLTGDWGGVDAIRLAYGDDTEILPNQARGNANAFHDPTVGNLDLWHPVNMWWVITATNSNVKVQLSSTTYMGHATLEAIGLHEISAANYEFSETTTSTPVGSSNADGPVVLQSGTVTPSVTEPYLIVGSCVWNITTVGNTQQLELRFRTDAQGSLDFDRQSMHSGDDSMWQTVMTVANISSAGEFVELEADVVGNPGFTPSSVAVAQSQLLMIPLSEFNDSSYTTDTSVFEVVDNAGDTNPPTATYQDLSDTVTHTPADTETRKYLIVAKANHGEYIGEIWHPGLRIDGQEVNYNNERLDAQARLRIWSNTCRNNVIMHTTHISQGGFTVDFRHTSGPYGASWQRTLLRNRVLLVLDLGPVPTEEANTVQSTGGAFGVTSVNACMGTPWAGESIRTLEALVFKGANGAYTFFDFITSFNTPFSIESVGVRGGIRVTSTTNDNIQFEITIDGAMPELDRWYHVVLRYVSSGNYTCYVGDTGRNSDGSQRGAWDTFPYAISGSSGQLSGSDDGLYGLGLTPNLGQSTTWQVGGPAGQTEDMDGGVCEIRAWAVALSDAQVDQYKDEFISWDASVSPLDRLFVCLRLNRSNPGVGFVGSGWRQLFPDAYWGGSTPGHPFSVSGPVVHPLSTEMNASADMELGLDLEIPMALDISASADMELDLALEQFMAIDIEASADMELDLDYNINFPDFEIEASASMELDLGVTVFMDLEIEAGASLDLDLVPDAILATEISAGASMELALAVTQFMDCEISAGADMELDLTVELPMALEITSGASMELDLGLEIPLGMICRSHSSMPSGPLLVDQEVVIYMQCFMGDASGSMTLDLTPERDLAVEIGAGAEMELTLGEILALEISAGASMDLDLAVQQELATEIGAGADLELDLFVSVPLATEIAATSSMELGMIVDHDLAINFNGSGDMDIALNVTPAGGVTEIIDSPEIDMLQGERTGSAGRWPNWIHGTFVMPTNFSANKQIRICRIPSGFQLTALSVSYDALAVGVCTLNLGVETDTGAFITGVDCTQGGIAMVSQGGPSARFAEYNIDLIISFNGNPTFTPGAEIRVAGNIMQMTDPERV